ncbi:molybdate ABC transporter substrate-binding protein [Thalassospira sp. MA62]|nr:molybdate ABC transporter substrate-binding protein [Thalassospira sp. MA62]
MRHFPRSLSVACVILGVTIISSTAYAKNITVFAAASLTDAMTKAAERFEEKTGDHVLLSFASSSTLARQIAAGAPADIFVSANQKWMDWLSDQDLIKTDTRHDVLANGLVLITPSDSALGMVTIDDQTGFLDMIGADDRIAVGDPDHVPAGIYARQSLESLKKWDVVEPRLARADNVRAALALVERGEAPLGIVYRTDAAIAQDVKIIGTFPANSHTPITYPVAITADATSSDATVFLDWVLGNEAADIFESFGFAAPDATEN